MSLESWLAESESSDDRPLLLLRHDVDQHPRSALRMAAIEADLEVKSTWYFRWRTAQPTVIDHMRAEGHSVGLHYETLTRMALERKVGVPEISSLIAEARRALKEEMEIFTERFGPIRSACPHGDTRVPGVHNGVLLRGERLADYGLQWDANEEAGRRRLDVWLTDRSSAEGRWKDRLDPLDLIIERRSPIMAVVHPNNWVSGAALWWDRVMPGGQRTVGDRPPWSASSGRA